MATTRKHRRGDRTNNIGAIPGGNPGADIGMGPLPPATRGSSGGSLGGGPPGGTAGEGCRRSGAASTGAAQNAATTRGNRPRNINLLSPPQGQTAADTASPPQTAARMPGQVCWRCRRLGHLQRECPAMEVGKVIRVDDPPASSPGPGETYYVPADASGRGLGAVLSQQRGGSDHPVLYISRKLSERETRYSTVGRECLAIRWAVGALRYYLLGRPFSLCSDHKPLQWLHRMKDPNARINRWYLALQPYNFRVVHRPGAQMVGRLPLPRSGVGSKCGRGPA
ncbi:uncharacterized protein LOC133559319 isoform X2 [Nerophis ophidion]|uniref:uncharacterized protein LOC133559319 isoform X2 n=1 Tax=Nerophis ophidion TaxID=159077 RepID=UPI002ADF245B|nr:uncharacterized protein LOC133559319 isoform X2 [Nerophis ophidion]